MKIKREYEIKRSCETERSKEKVEQPRENNNESERKVRIYVEASENKSTMSEKENEKSENNGEVESSIKKEIQKEKEEEESFCVKQKDVRVACSSNQPSLELEYKKINFATTDINLSLPNVDVSLQQGFEKEFPKIFITS